MAALRRRRTPTRSPSRSPWPDASSAARICPLETVFFGGGTPTLLPPDDLARILGGLVDTSAWPREPRSPPRPTRTRSTPPGWPRSARPASPASRSACSRPCLMCWPGPRPDPRPRTGAAGRRVGRAAGFEGVSLDLIYGTPGESLDDWRQSLEAAVAARTSTTSRRTPSSSRTAPGSRPGSVAARCPGPTRTTSPTSTPSRTSCSRRPGYRWYEVSNWARSREQSARHNLGYWRGHDWWGFGPGAHSHVGGTRWWNVRHPSAWASRLATGASPAQAREVLGDDRAARGAGAPGGTSRRRAVDLRARRSGPPGRRRRSQRRAWWTPDASSEGRLAADPARTAARRPRGPPTSAVRTYGFAGFRRLSALVVYGGHMSRQQTGSSTATLPPRASSVGAMFLDRVKVAPSAEAFRSPARRR